MMAAVGSDNMAINANNGYHNHGYRRQGMLLAAVSPLPTVTTEKKMIDKITILPMYILLFYF
jgi:hypothetical protein